MVWSIFCDTEIHTLPNRIIQNSCIKQVVGIRIYLAISFLSDKLNSMKTQKPSDHNGHKDPDAITISAVLPTRIYFLSYISLCNCVTNVWNKTFYNKGLAWDFKWHISIFARNTFIGFKLIGKEKLRLTSSIFKEC